MHTSSGGGCMHTCTQEQGPYITTFQWCVIEFLAFAWPSLEFLTLQNIQSRHGSGNLRLVVVVQ